MQNAFTRIDLGKLYPPFAQAIIQLQTNCAIRGVHYYWTSGYRAHEEQAKLYAQGRTTPGPIITNSKPGSSYHNYGIASDATHDSDLKKPGLQPDWLAPHYDVLGEECAKIPELVWGGTFTSLIDRPHVQWRLPPGVGLADLSRAHKQGGIQAAWNLLKTG